MGMNIKLKKEEERLCIGTVWSAAPHSLRFQGQKGKAEPLCDNCQIIYVRVHNSKNDSVDLLHKSPKMESAYTNTSVLS